MMATVYCDDWSCPARVSCALHAGRSKEYAAMRPFKYKTRERDKDVDSCAEYKFDRQKKWLKISADQLRFVGAV